MSRPAALDSRRGLDLARLQLTQASTALEHWHAGPAAETGRAYTGYGQDAVTAIDRAIGALQQARAALVAERRRDQDARAARVDRMLNRSRPPSGDQ